MKSKIDWGALASALLSATIKPILEKFLIRIIGISSGFQVWLVTFLAKHAMAEVVIPLLNAGVTELQFSYDKDQGKVHFKQLEEATNEAEHISAITNILS